MKHTSYCLVSGTLFALVATGHLLRILFDLPLIIGDYTAPLLLSWLGVIGPALLSTWAFRLSAAAQAGH